MIRIHIKQQIHKLTSKQKRMVRINSYDTIVFINMNVIVNLIDNNDDDLLLFLYEQLCCSKIAVTVM